VILGDPGDRARELLDKTELFEELGLHELARLSRLVARDVLELVDQVGFARSALRASDARADRLETIVGRLHAGRGTPTPEPEEEP
jgi:hypothetical protein